MTKVVYANQPETLIYSAKRFSSKVKNHVLMGTWLEVLSSENKWLKVKTAGRGPGGFVSRDHVRDTPCLKIFIVDVGQGDGAIVESPAGRILIDGGPNSKYHAFLRHLYGPTIRAGHKIHFDAVVVSHPDADHFQGLTKVLLDKDFTFGTIYHNGIIRYKAGSPSGRPFDLGRLHLNSDGQPLLVETFDDLDQVQVLIAQGDLMAGFRRFWQAALDARERGALDAAKLLSNRDQTLNGFSDFGDGLKVEVLGPVPDKQEGPIAYVTFSDPHQTRSTRPSSSHTRNGHSVVLKLSFGKHSFLFGGDLNIPAEKHLMAHYGDDNPFRVDVAKACHHGSSDFSVDFLKLVQPQVNVFSSGDNKSFDHPMADATGASARHTRGDYPLFFSTELARAHTKSRIHYGLINARSNGEVLVMAQMKEQRNKADVWDSYTVPWVGKLHATRKHD